MVTLCRKPVEDRIVRQAQVMPENVDQNVGFGHDAGIVVTLVLSPESLERKSTFSTLLASVEEDTDFPKGFGFPLETQL